MLIRRFLDGAAGTGGFDSILPPPWVHHIASRKTGRLELVL